jgi:hypothetical protein
MVADGNIPAIYIYILPINVMVYAKLYIILLHSIHSYNAVIRLEKTRNASNYCRKSS